MISIFSFFSSRRTWESTKGSPLVFFLIPLFSTYLVGAFRFAPIDKLERVSIFNSGPLYMYSVVANYSNRMSNEGKWMSVFLNLRRGQRTTDTY